MLVTRYIYLICFLGVFIQANPFCVPGGMVYVRVRAW
jgi:hypothetical protein